MRWPFNERRDFQSGGECRIARATFKRGMMSMLQRWRKLGVGTMLALLSLSACSSNSDGDTGKPDVTTLPPLAKKSTYRVGFVQVWEDNSPWRAANTASIQAEAAKRGYELVFETGSGFGATDEVARMEAVIAA